MPEKIKLTCIQLRDFFFAMLAQLRLFSRRTCRRGGLGRFASLRQCNQSSCESCEADSPVIRMNQPAAYSMHLSMCYRHTRRYMQICMYTFSIGCLHKQAELTPEFSKAPMQGRRKQIIRLACFSRQPRFDGGPGTLKGSGQQIRGLGP